LGLAIVSDDLATPSYPIAPPVKFIDSVFLTLQRVERTRTSDFRKRDWSGDKGKGKPTKGLLKRYENMINSTSSSPSIKMSYTFEYCSDLGDAALPREIYAAIIRLSTEKQYKSIPDIPVSYLKQSSNNSSSFISQEVVVEFVPEEPFPADFEVTVTFSDSEGRTMECHLAPLSLLFTDLFLPMQLPSGYSDRDETGNAALAQLFEELWGKIHKESESNDGPTSSQAIESIRCLHVDKEIVEDGINQWLEPFLVTVQGNSVHAAVLLPPHYHVLFKMLLETNRTVVAIATDNWHILPWINNFLIQVEQG
jgi:AP-5 complex subunit beta-1